MNTNFSRIFLFIAIQLVLMVSLTTGVFASDPIFTQIPTGITGHVWLDVNSSGKADQQEPVVANAPVFIQRVDAHNDDAVMTMIVYTDEIGGFALAGLDAGTYQIWTESDSDSVSFLVVTIDAVNPTVTADLLMPVHQVFMPTVMR